MFRYRTVCTDWMLQATLYSCAMPWRKLAQRAALISQNPTSLDTAGASGILMISQLTDEQAKTAQAWQRLGEANAAKGVTVSHQQREALLVHSRVHKPVYAIYNFRGPAPQMGG